MVAALTFDDGPSQWTAPILDLLAAHKAHATFFVTGAYIFGEARQTILDILDAGHEVGNHTETHPHLSTMPTWAILTELKNCNGAISVCGYLRGPKLLPPPTLWRAPYLDLPEIAVRCGQEYGLIHVGADVIAGDWALDDPQRIAQNVLSELNDGDIVLLHDGIPPDGGTGTKSRQPTVDALALLLDTPGVTWTSYGGLP